MLRAILLGSMFGGALAHPCDKEHGSFCASESLDTLGSCLSNVESAGDSCKEWLKVQNLCSSDLSTFCGGMAFTDDSMLCLTQWTNVNDLSAQCQAALPKPKEEEEEELDEESLRRKEARKKRRKNRAASVRSYEKMKAKEAEKAEKAAINKAKKEADRKRKKDSADRKRKDRKKRKKGEL